jgi:DNA-directed RNA polymerase sigma subunit (sigma70/sigma32)
MTNSIYQKGRTIRTPVVKARNISKTFKAFNELKSELNREPTTEELADFTGFAEKKVKKLMRAKVDTVSMQTAIKGSGTDEGKAKHVEDFVPTSHDTVEEIARSEEYEAIDDAINSLSEIEQYIVRNYTQLNGKPKKTFQALGQELGKSKQAVRAILVRSQRKMRKYLQNEKGISR